jgi:integrase
VVERQRADDIVFALRFRAYGERQYLTVGRASEGWSRAKAETELANILADVRRGLWQPWTPDAVEAPTAPQTFHTFASEWLAAREPELRPRTIADYRWALELHLLPFFGGHKLDEISIEEVDRYKADKLREAERRRVAIKAGEPLRDEDGKPLEPLSPNSINKTLTRLAQILEVAVEYGRIDRNPAAGRRRRVKPVEPKRTWVEPEQLTALIDAGDVYLRPLIATLAGAGLRIGEACDLNWRDVNLQAGTLTVAKSKTAAGEGREVDLPVGLYEELATWRATSPRTRPTDPVFVSGRPRNGSHARQTPRNAQARIRTAVKAANVELRAAGIEEIAAVTPHSLRRTYASLRAALRDDPIYIAEQLGHRDARFTFRIYQRAAKRRERLQGRYLAAFDGALEWATMRTGEPVERDALTPAERAELDV